MFLYFEPLRGELESRVYVTALFGLSMTRRVKVAIHSEPSIVTQNPECQTKYAVVCTCSRIENENISVLVYISMILIWPIITPRIQPNFYRRVNFKEFYWKCKLI